MFFNEVLFIYISRHVSTDRNDSIFLNGLLSNTQISKPLFTVTSDALTLCWQHQKTHHNASLKHCNLFIYRLYRPWVNPNAAWTNKEQQASSVKISTLTMCVSWRSFAGPLWANKKKKFKQQFRRRTPTLTCCFETEKLLTQLFCVQYDERMPKFCTKLFATTAVLPPFNLPLTLH